MANSTELSVEFILQLKAELDADIRLYDELPRRIEQRKKRYEAALLFAPAGFDPSMPLVEVEVPDVSDAPNVAPSEFTLISTEEQNSQNRPSWTVAIMSALDSCGRGLSHKDLLASVRAAIPEMPSSNGEKGFYNGVAKLAERGHLIKHGGLLYSAKVVEQMKRRGESLPDAPDLKPRSGSSGEVILSVLRDYPNGLSGPDLKKIVGANPDAPRSLRDHGQYIYNILATLIGSGLVEKQEGVYRVIEKVD